MGINRSGRSETRNRARWPSAAIYRDRSHRARAAFRATARRFDGDNFLALAFPPLNPPLRLASVAGVGAAGRVFSASPVTMSTIILASWLGSRGRLGWFAIPDPLADPDVPRYRHRDGLKFKLSHYRNLRVDDLSVPPPEAFAPAPSKNDQCWLRKQLATLNA